MAEKQVKFTVTADAQSLIKALKDGEKGFDGLGKKSSQMGKILRGVGKAAFSAVAAGIGFSINKAADFEKSMSRVGALSGATAAEMDALTKTARDLGATTAFTATEAAEGMQFLSMAGFSAQESIAAMPGLLATAAAGQLELGRAADITSNILSGFGLAATETGKVADVLTKTFTSSNTTLEQLGEGMKFVAPVAAGLGISIEETAAAMGKLGDAGVQGTLGGTQLRQILLSLSAPSAAAKDIMEQFGIAVFDADGKMRPLPDVLASVQQGLSGMSEAQRVAALKTLVGQRAVSGFSVLLDSSSGPLQQFVSDLENAGGTAEQIANQQLDNLSGQLTILNSAVEDVAISAGEVLIPVLTDLATTSSEGIGIWKSNVQIWSDLSEAFSRASEGVEELSYLEQAAADSSKEAVTTSQLLEQGLTSLAHTVIENTVGWEDLAFQYGITSKEAGGLVQAQAALNPATMGLVAPTQQLAQANKELAAGGDDLAESYRETAAAATELAATQTDQTQQSVELQRIQNLSSGTLEGYGVNTQSVADKIKYYNEQQEKAVEIEQARMETARGLATTLADAFLGMTDAQQSASESAASFNSQIASIGEESNKKIEEAQQKSADKIAEIEAQKQERLHFILTGAHDRTTAENDALLGEAEAHFEALKQAEITAANDSVAELQAAAEAKAAAAQSARAKELEEQKKHLEELKLNAALTALETTGQLEALTGGLATSAADAAALIRAGVIPVTQDLGLALQNVFTGMESRSAEAAGVAQSNMELLGQAMAGTLEGTVHPAIQSTTDALSTIGVGTESIGADLGAGIESGLTPSIDNLANTTIPTLDASFNTANTNAQTGLTNTLLATQNEDLALQLMTGETLPALQEMFGVMNEEVLLGWADQLVATETENAAILVIANSSFPAMQSSAVAATSAATAGLNRTAAAAIKTESSVRKVADAGDKIRSELIPPVNDAARAFEKLAAAARAAAAAARAAANAAKNSGAGGGARAEGGPVSLGRSYLVGELGPELFVPGSHGQIVPNDQLQIGGQQTVTNNYSYNLTINSNAKSPENPTLDMMSLMALTSNAG